MAHLEFGPRLLDRIMTDLTNLAEKDRPERMEGRRLVTVIKPTKGAHIRQEVGNNKSATENPAQVQDD